MRLPFIAWIMKICVMFLGFAAGFVIGTFFAANVAFGHENHRVGVHPGADGKMPGGHHHPPCAHYLEKSEAPYPNLAKLTAKYSTETMNGQGWMIFWADESGRTVALTSSGTEPQTGTFRSRLSWEVGDSIRTVHPGEDEMVCELPILVHDGVRYDLDHLLETLLRKTEKAE